MDSISDRTWSLAHKQRRRLDAFNIGKATAFSGVREEAIRLPFKKFEYYLHKEFWRGYEEARKVLL
tara:strand:- start:190 stop:387 length:198 start_codon:yes stop_codon:yes gene_type:complete